MVPGSEYYTARWGPWGWRICESQGGDRFFLSLWDDDPPEIKRAVIAWCLNRFDIPLYDYLDKMFPNYIGGT